MTQIEKLNAVRKVLLTAHTDLFELLEHEGADCAFEVELLSRLVEHNKCAICAEVAKSLTSDNEITITKKETF